MCIRRYREGKTENGIGNTRKDSKERILVRKEQLEANGLFNTCTHTHTTIFTLQEKLSETDETAVMNT